VELQRVMPPSPHAPAPSTSLSLCLIVRDAERSLEAALSSAAPFVDEIVVVDTGSVDATRQIAGRFGARLFDFAWRDDFSAARNYSLRQATGNWIFWMDADDVWPASSGQALRRLLAGRAAGDAAFLVWVEEACGDGARRQRHTQVRLFPRHPQIRFTYRVHEQVAPSIRALGLPIVQTDIVVRHQADRSPAAERARAERNLRLALLDFHDRPHDPFIWFTLGSTYLFFPDGLAMAVKFLRKSVAGLARGAQVQLNAYYYLAQALSRTGDRQGEEQACREALALFPDDAALLLRLGHVCRASGRHAEAVECYQAVLERGQVRPHAIYVSHGDVEAVLQLGRLYAEMGAVARAQQLWQAFLSRHPDPLVRQALEALDAG
jgi:tetratricopeptide (TPR) repeat protein